MARTSPPSHTPEVQSSQEALSKTLEFPGVGTNASSGKFSQPSQVRGY